MLTEFCFDAVARLASTNFNIEKHYGNIPRLLEVYLQSSGSELAKRLQDMKASGLAFRVSCA